MTTDERPDKEVAAPKRTSRKFSAARISDFKKHYPTYFSLTAEAKRSLAASLDVPIRSLTRWMYLKRRREKKMEIRTVNYLTTYEQQHDKNVSGTLINMLFMYI